MLFLLVIVSYLSLHTLSSASLAKNCFPAGPPCPSHFKQCLKIRIHYTNDSNEEENNTIVVGESVEIVLPGILPSINQYYNTRLTDGSPTDCFVDIDLLDRKTGFTDLNISLLTRDTPTNNCAISLPKEELTGSPTYNIQVTQSADHQLYCVRD